MAQLLATAVPFHKKVICIEIKEMTNEIRCSFPLNIFRSLSC
jgi:hypothetical protein